MGLPVGSVHHRTPTCTRLAAVAVTAVWKFDQFSPGDRRPSLSSQCILPVLRLRDAATRGRRRTSPPAGHVSIGHVSTGEFRLVRCRASFGCSFLAPSIVLRLSSGSGPARSARIPASLSCQRSIRPCVAFAQSALCVRHTVVPSILCALWLTPCIPRALDRPASLVSFLFSFQSTPYAFRQLPVDAVHASFPV